MPPCPRDLRERESIELGRVAKVKYAHTVTEFHGVSTIVRGACRARGGGGAGALKVICYARIFIHVFIQIFWCVCSL